MTLPIALCGKVIWPLELRLFSPAHKPSWRIGHTLSLQVSWLQWKTPLCYSLPVQYYRGNHVSISRLWRRPDWSLVRSVAKAFLRSTFKVAVELAVQKWMAEPHVINDVENRTIDLLTFKAAVAKFADSKAEKRFLESTKGKPGLECIKEGSYRPWDNDGRLIGAIEDGLSEVLECLEEQVQRKQINLKTYSNFTASNRSKAGCNNRSQQKGRSTRYRTRRHYRSSLTRLVDLDYSEYALKGFVLVDGRYWKAVDYCSYRLSNRAQSYNNDQPSETRKLKKGSPLRWWTSRSKKRFESLSSTSCLGLTEPVILSTCKRNLNAHFSIIYV